MEYEASGSPAPPALAVADLGPRPCSDPGSAVHAIRVFDSAGEEWSGLVAFRRAADGRDSAEAIARELRAVAASAGAPSPALALASMSEPVQLFDRRGA